MKYFTTLTATLLISLFSYAPIAAQAPSAQPDTAARAPHVLKPVEILGVKQSADITFDAVTSISPAMIRRYGIAAMKDISIVTPNIYIPDYGSRMTSTVYSRGLGARIDQPVVGLTIDNVPVLNKDAYDFDIADIQNIEVIRGAQSALNGRNTMGGQINITTYSPWTYKGIRAMAEYGRFNSLKASLGWYGSRDNEIGTSISGYYSRSDGYYRNLYNGSRVGAGEQSALRWKAAWRPSAALSLVNTASASVSRQHGYPYERLETGMISYNDTCFYRRNTLADGLTVAWAGKRVVVTSLTSVQYIDDNMTLDQDFTPEDYFTLVQKRREFAVTQDLFTRGRRGAYSWLGGVFGFWRNSTMKAPVTFFDAGISNLIEYYPNKYNPDYPIEWRDREFMLGSDFRSRNGGFALYHESVWRTGAWTFEGALRWDVEHAELDYLSHCDDGYRVWHVLPDGTRELYNDVDVKINDKGTLKRTFSQLLPKITVGYTLDRGRLYASFSKGYKAGGFNTQMFSDVLQQRLRSMLGMGMAYDPEDVITYEPEKSFNYEIGAKIACAGGRLKIDATAFFIDCRDQQLTMFPPGTTTGRIMTNAGRTFSRGAELSLVYTPVDHLTLRASYGYTHATFHRFNDGKTDYAGKRLPYAPAHTSFVGADWRIPCNRHGITPALGVDLRGVGDIYWNEANTVKQPFYAILGLSASLSKGNCSLRLWAENVTSTRYSVFYFLSMGNAFVQRGRPTTFGATLRINIE